MEGRSDANKRAVLGYALCMDDGKSENPRTAEDGEAVSGFPEPPGKVVAGRVMLEGRDLLRLSEREMRAIRGKDIAMIFQEPMTSLNPVLTIGSQIAEAVLLHEKVSSRQAWQKAVDMLRLARISEPEQRAH